MLGRYSAVDWIARLSPDPAFSRKALFYVAGGIVGACMFALVWMLTPWRPVERRIAVALVCCWGMLEESQTAICRIGLGLSTPAPPLDHWRGICDHLSGLPISTMTLAIPVCIAYWLANNRGTQWPNQLQPPL